MVQTYTKLDNGTIVPKPNGKFHNPPTLERKSRLAGLVATTPDIEIGSGAEAADVECGTMEDAAERIKAIKFLVPGWVPYGMVTGLVAEPGVGKSAFGLWLARSIVAGCGWFDGSMGPSKPGKVLWCDTENGVAITVQRMRDWKMPMNRVLLPFKDPLQTINLSEQGHLDTIEAIVNRHKPLAVFIDSLRGAHDGDENCSRVGKVLQGLSGIAERTKAAFLVVHHTRKLMVEEEITANSSRGSNAILAMMRSQIGFDKPDAKGEWVRVRMLKENLGLKPLARGFRWYADGTGLEFGPAPTKPRKETKKENAADWLRMFMEPGKWHLATELQDAAKRFGFSANAVQRAREDIGVTTAAKTIRTNDEGKSEWTLPPESGGKS